jgi:hypothetical protein
MATGIPSFRLAVKHYSAHVPFTCRRVGFVSSLRLREKAGQKGRYFIIQQHSIDRRTVLPTVRLLFKTNRLLLADLTGEDKIA